MNPLLELETPGCPTCRWGAFAQERYLVSFVNEHYADGQTLASLRSSIGFCAAHTRRLLCTHAAPWVMRHVYAEVFPAAIARLQSRNALRMASQCPLCSGRSRTEGAITRAIVGALGQDHVASAYRKNGGFCFPHLRDVLPFPGSKEATTLIATFATRLDAPLAPPVLIDLLAGAIDRCSGAETTRIATTDAAFTSGWALEDPQKRLEVDTCPSCLAGRLMETRYLEWLAAEAERSPSSLAAEGVWLCARHLHYLTVDHGDTATWVARLERATLAAEVTLLEQRLDQRPRTLFGRLRRNSGVRSSLRPLLRSRECNACQASGTAEKRESARLVAALLDPPTADRYDRSHGLCLRHVLALPETEAVRPGRILHARLSMLQWQLEEAGRKSSWAVRYEARGDETTAWWRSAGYLDGAGLPIDLDSRLSL